MRKSVGDQTFCQFRGENVCKQKIETNESNTLEQQRQRARWKKGQDLTVLFGASTEIGYPGRPRTYSPDNAFRHENVNDRVIDVVEAGGTSGGKVQWTVTVNYSEILCAKGPLRLPREISLALSEESDAVLFTVGVEQRGPQRNEDDVLYAMLVETVIEDSLLSEICTRGEGGMASVELPSGWDAVNLAVYLFVVSADGKKASNSRYTTVG